MPVKKNRTQSKCRDWERQRRSRLCSAFSQLATLLPATPPTSAKILILQHSIKYIQELQQIHKALKPLDNSLPEQQNIETSLRKELSVLQERCSHLINQLKQAGISADENVSPTISTTDSVKITTVVSNKVLQDEVQSCKMTIENIKGSTETILNDGISMSEKNPENRLKTPPPSNNSTGVLTEQKINKTSKNQDNKLKKKIKRNVHITKKKNTRRKLQLPSPGHKPCFIVSSNGIGNVAQPISLAIRNNQNNSVWVTSNNLGVVGNSLLPLLPLTAPLLIPPVPQPTIYLLQRPIVNESCTTDSAKKSNIFPINNMPLLKQPIINQPKQVHKIYSNFYGFDITKTTMVNKVPIPAFSSTLSMNKKDIRPLRVTQRSRSKLIHSLNSSKKPQDAKAALGKNKENLVKTNIVKAKESKVATVEVVPSSSETNKPLKDATPNIKSVQVINNLDCDVKLCENNLSTNDVTSVHNIISINECNSEDKTKEKNSLKQNDIKKNNDSVNVDKTCSQSFSGFEMDKKCEPQTSKSVSNLPDNKMHSSDDSESPCLLNIDGEKHNQFIKDSNHKLVDNMGSESLYAKSRDNIMNEGKIHNHSGILDKHDGAHKNEGVKKRKCENDAVQSSLNSFNSTTERSGNNNSDCGIETKTVQLDDRSLGPAEIAEDLLASFGGGSEQVELPPSPLASSPMVASPTAAFLLAFPLVCPGPRPDTPLNDNLQTPNICSLDNFSTFFSNKESANSASNNMFLDCHSKHPAVQLSADKSKASWSYGEQNNQSVNKLMPYGDVFDSSKYAVKAVDNFKLTDKSYHSKPSVTSSSACAYPDSQTLFPNSKAINSNSFYSLPESIFTYEHTPVMNNTKDSKNNATTTNQKNQFYFENIASQSGLKNKLALTNDNSLYTSMASSYIENMPSSNSANNPNKINTYGVLPTLNEANSCRKHQASENSMKIVLPGVIPEYSTGSKSIDASFTFSSQVKSSIYSSSANIYTSCNTYNPFSSDFSTNSANAGLPCGNSVNGIRTKSSTGCFPDFNAPNIYSQNCATWTDENLSVENKKTNAPMILNQSSHIPTEIQPDFRFTLPLISKSSNNKSSNNTLDLKNAKNNSNKSNNRDVKYSTVDNKNVKPDFSVQKVPVNWMTSDVVSGHHTNDMFLPNYSKDLKSEQNSLHANVNQPCGDFSNISGIPSSLTCKKSDSIVNFDQPFYHMPPGSYAGQVINDDNQFTWSPSKLPPLGDSLSLAPCSLPTLVGDLALSIGTEPKLTYPGTLVEHDTLGKDRKNISVKNKELYTKNNSTQNVECNSSNSAGNFLSVSQLMERGKAGTNLNDNSLTSCKSSVQYNQKKTPGSDHARQYGIHPTNSNKVFDTSNGGPLPLFPLDASSAHQHAQLSLPLQQKDTNFNVKLDSNSKSLNKNNYSTEALLQNNHPQYQNNRKHKHSSSIQKAYHDVSNSSASTSLIGNQHAPVSHPLQFDNYPQSQQYNSNTFHYGSQSVSGMNSSFYSSSNFIPAPTTMVASNYMNTGFASELSDFSNNTNENLFYVPKLETCKSKSQNEITTDVAKYPFNNKQFAVSKESTVKHRQDSGFKKDASQNAKRPKKHKTPYAETYSHYGAMSNSVNSPVGLDDSFFGYFSSSQMHPYPSQPPILPTIPPVGQNSQKMISGSGKPVMAVNNAMSASPNPTGTSLTNFNLSTIFPEINKRTSMPGFLDSQQPSSHTSKASCPILFQ